MGEASLGTVKKQLIICLFGISLQRKGIFLYKGLQKKGISPSPYFTLILLATPSHSPPPRSSLLFNPLHCKLNSPISVHPLSSYLPFFSHMLLTPLQSLCIPLIISCLFSSPYANFPGFCCFSPHMHVSFHGVIPQNTFPSMYYLWKHLQNYIVIQFLYTVDKYNFQILD